MLITGDLVFVSKCIVGDLVNLIYRIVCSLCAYVYYLLFRQGMAPYNDYMIAVMCGDYLFMVILAIIVIVFLGRSFSQHGNYTNYIMLAFSTLLFYNSACVFFGGIFYIVPDWESHINNVCNVSTIITALVYLILTSLECFVVSTCGGGIVLDPDMRDIDWRVRLMVKVLLTIFVIAFLVTLFYSFIETHHFNNMRSGYVYPTIDLTPSYR